MTPSPAAARPDVIVIGTGQAGVPLATRLAAAGRRVVIVERGNPGGTCVNNGCTPTKTLVASARAAWVARHAADFGVRIAGEVTIDYAAVRARMMKVVQGSRDGLGHWIAGTANLSLVHGEARFAGPDSVQVGGQVLQAPRIFLNVGARPVVPGWIAQSGVPYLTSESLMALQELPTHLVILGAGYIALEYAQVYARFGGAVTVIEHGARLLPREDDESAATVKAVLERDGVRFMIGADATALERDGAGVALVVDGRRIVGSHVLVAVGRRPNTDGLDLARTGQVLILKFSLAAFTGNFLLQGPIVLFQTVARGHVNLRRDADHDGGDERKLPAVPQVVAKRNGRSLESMDDEHGEDDCWNRKSDQQGQVDHPVGQAFSIAVEEVQSLLNQQREIRQQQGVGQRHNKTGLQSHGPEHRINRNRDRNVKLLLLQKAQ